MFSPDEIDFWLDAKPSAADCGPAIELQQPVQQATSNDLARQVLPKRKDNSGEAHRRGQRRFRAKKKARTL